ncbi:hypothetical protein E2L06_13725 [Haloterrigena sp. H1]|uniref:DUF7344 domain-containing protein n=1 Tax=Haloterrigena sp. H1 TaxID=2552943 RepID=UPI00110F45DA|nr:hypothetical protein [Haloterrigena sp. H1]TMT87585.1 hypothetical protein E2L06_13725 [Haloterrigena sp. H1]
MSERNAGSGSHDRDTAADADRIAMSIVADGGTPDLDQFLSVLRDRRRRCVLYCLLDGDVRERGVLARRVAARLDRVSPADVPERRSDQVEAALAHVDLPMLAAADVISYDHRTGSFQFDDLPGPLEALIDACAPFDEFAHIDELSDDSGADTPARDR